MKKILFVFAVVMATSVWAEEEENYKDTAWTPLSIFGVPWNCDKTVGVSLFSSSKYPKYVYGIEANLLRGAREAYGVQIGVLRNYVCELYGFQVGTINHMEGGCGLQVGALNFHNDSGNSVQIGFVNAPFMRSNIGSGIQIGILNGSNGGIRFQVGAINLAADSACIQIGCVNSSWRDHFNPSGKMSCIQIGFLNFRNGNEFSPIIGWSF